MKAKLLKLPTFEEERDIFSTIQEVIILQLFLQLGIRNGKVKKKRKKNIIWVYKIKYIFEFIKSRIEVICNYVNSSDWTSNLNSFVWDELPRIEVNFSRFFFLIPNHMARNIKKLERAFSIYFSYRGNKSTSNQLICLHLNTVWYQIIIELNWFATSWIQVNWFWTWIILFRMNGIWSHSII